MIKEPKALLNKTEPNYIDVVRFIGIFLVVFGHFPFSEDAVFFKNAVYTFHMPLFFIISGLLHKQEEYSLSSFKKNISSLIIPYMLYNVLYIIPYCIANNIYEIRPIFRTIINIVLVKDVPNIPTWFFITLFSIKILALFLKSKTSYIVISILFIILFYIQGFFQIPYVFAFKATLAALPFFTLGFLSKNAPLIKHEKIISLLLLLISLIFVYIFVKDYGRVDMYKGIYGNIFLYFFVPVAMSISIINLSKYIPLKNNFIKIISRGTMFIVGTHWIITEAIKHIFHDMHLISILILSLIITLLYYIPIHYTYTKFPILYGKLGDRSRN